LTSESTAGARLKADDAVAARPPVDGTAATLAITPRLLLSVVVPAIAALNVLNAVAVFLYYHSHHDGGRFFLAFSLDKEANVPSWFSSALLLTAAAVLALVALDALARNAPWGRHWGGLSLVFVALSLDETAEIHEHIDHAEDGHGSAHGLILPQQVEETVEHH